MNKDIVFFVLNGSYRKQKVILVFTQVVVSVGAPAENHTAENSIICWWETTLQPKSVNGTTQDRTHTDWAFLQLRGMSSAKCEIPIHFSHSLKLWLMLINYWKTRTPWTDDWRKYLICHVLFPSPFEKKNCMKIYQFGYFAVDHWYKYEI